MTIKSACEYLLPKTYEDVWYRGEVYADRGLVKVVVSTKKEIRALVKGGSEYVTTLEFSGNSLLRKCNCPFASDGGSRSPACKHMVALSIVWDENRHIDRPSREDIETESIPPPLVSRFDLERAHQNPLKADLEIIRLAPTTGGYAKPHARLPLMPRINADASKPLSLAEIRGTGREIMRWTKQPLYDKYSCSGEMIAAVCEILRIIKTRIPSTRPEDSPKILREMQKTHLAVVKNCVDDSDGLHKFGEAHLEAIYDQIKKLRTKINPADRPFFDQELWDFEVHRDDY